MYPRCMQCHAAPFWLLLIAHGSGAVLRTGRSRSCSDGESGANDLPNPTARLVVSSVDFSAPCASC